MVAAELGLGRKPTFEADTVCIVTYHDVNDELAEHLAVEHRDAGFAVHVVGDADGSDSILEAIHSAAAATRSI